ncbi:MAG: ammonium transporter [Bacillota bacterium]|nr:ammonium transporter [Bacillota bacterium]
MRHPEHPGAVGRARRAWATWGRGATRVLLGLAVVLVVASLFVAPAFAAGDPNGAATGGIGDVPAARAGAPTLREVAQATGHDTVGINFVWTLVTGFLVFFMQAGFALVETGFTRAKNAAHTIAMNLMVFLVGAIGYWLVGFAIQFGGVGHVAALGGTPPLSAEWAPGGWGLFGHHGFLLSSGGAYDVGVFALFLFQMVFMDTAVTIPTGAMAERVKFAAVVASSFFISMVLYPFFGNWVWGGGWLAQLGTRLGLGHGVVDFAGSGVVHAIGGAAGLAGALVLGPRIGRYGRDGKPRPMPGHDIPMAILGTIILFFGWFGFNPGSTLAGTDLRISVVAVNTMMAGAVGGFVAMVYAWIRTGKPDPGMMANGVLAGLVAITAPSAFVNSVAAVLIGAVAGVLVYESMGFFDRIHVDDPVGAISVHFVNGIWGVLSVGLFADGTYGIGWNGVGTSAARGVAGLFYGDPSQLLAQLVDVAVIVVWGFGLSYAFFRALDALMGIRVSQEVELGGLDLPEMGALAYPDFVLRSEAEAEAAFGRGRLEVEAPRYAGGAGASPTTSG